MGPTLAHRAGRRRGASPTTTMMLQMGPTASMQAEGFRAETVLMRIC
jgi:hypothetical protein